MQTLNDIMQNAFNTANPVNVPEVYTANFIDNLSDYEAQGDELGMYVSTLDIFSKAFERLEKVESQLVTLNAAKEKPTQILIDSVNLNLELALEPLGGSYIIDAATVLDTEEPLQISLEGVSDVLEKTISTIVEFMNKVLHMVIKFIEGLLSKTKRLHNMYTLAKKKVKAFKGETKGNVELQNRMLFYKEIAVPFKDHIETMKMLSVDDRLRFSNSVVSMAKSGAEFIGQDNEVVTQKMFETFSDILPTIHKYYGLMSVSDQEFSKLTGLRLKGTGGDQYIPISRMVSRKTLPGNYVFYFALHGSDTRPQMDIGLKGGEGSPKNRLGPALSKSQMFDLIDTNLAYLRSMNVKRDSLTELEKIASNYGKELGGMIPKNRMVLANTLKALVKILAGIYRATPSYALAHSAGMLSYINSSLGNAQEA